MHTGAVVALRIIFEDQFPIRVHVVLDLPCRTQLRQVPVREFSAQRREHFFQWRRRVRQIDEDEPLPRRQVYGVQRIIGFFKAGHIVHVRCTDESTVERVGPRVIGTLNRGHMSPRFLAQPSPAMSTNIVEAAQARRLYREQQSDSRLRLPEQDNRRASRFGSGVPTSTHCFEKIFACSSWRKFPVKRNTAAAASSRLTRRSRSSCETWMSRSFASRHAPRRPDPRQSSCLFSS